MSSYYLPQPYDRDENQAAGDIADGLGAIVLTVPLRVCLIATFRVMIGFISLSITQSQGLKPSHRLADDRNQILEFFADLFDEQVAWSEKAQENQANFAKANNAQNN